MIILFYEDFEENSKFIFNFYDFDRDGKISKEDIRTVLSYITLNEGEISDEYHITYKTRDKSQEDLFNIIELCFKDEKSDYIDYQIFIYIVENINSEGAISSACFLNDNKQNLILTSDSDGNAEQIKVFDFKGSKIKEIKESKEQTFFIDTYYDIKFNKIYILTGNNGFIKVYDYNNNEVKNKYCGNSKSYHNSIFVNDYDLILKIIESSEDGNIRIWNFNSGELIDKIKVSDN